MTTFPVVRDKPPDTPVVPPSAVRMLKTPLDVALPYPVIIDTAPPVDAVASPALTTMRPPAEIDPLPTAMLTDPLVPLVASPVLNVITPLLPFDVVPDENDNDPLVPSAPEFAVRTLKTPLDAARP